uniref:Uncharacterized protein n=1 Tax=Rhizophora mucronata TaxID=61149 RepID=A0A2P2Q2H1_RHIMU
MSLRVECSPSTFCILIIVRLQ